MSPEDTGTPVADPMTIPKPKVAAATPAPSADTKDYRSPEDWSGIPLYKCPFCPHALAVRDGKGDGNGAIELHILSKIDSGDAKHMAALDNS